MLRALQIGVLLLGVAFFLALAGLAYYSSGPSLKPNEQQAAAQTDAEQPQENERTFRGFVNFLFPDAITIFTFWLVVATICLGIIAYIQIGFLTRAEEISTVAANAAQQSANVARDTLVATERPWISVKMQIGPKGLSFDRDGAHLDVTIILKNSGKTPAVGVSIQGMPQLEPPVSIVHGLPIMRGIAAQDEICNAAKRQPFDLKGVGFTIFPGDTLTTNMLFGFGNEEAVKNIIAEQSQNPNRLYYPVFVGCVDYFTTLGDDLHHQSRFYYNVGRVSTGGELMQFRYSDGDRLASELILNPWIEASGFQAD
jgi:hypothetical protein